MPSKEDLLSAMAKPSDEALRLHPLYKGKVQLMPKCPIRTPDDFSIWYTPGVAAVCTEDGTARSRAQSCGSCCDEGAG
jgi:malate dehydrogenase (oxaloacetate-decarboxylating)